MYRSIDVSAARIRADVLASGGCIRQLAVKPDSKWLTVWADRGKPNDPRFWMNGCWPGYWGRSTNIAGVGGVLPIEGDDGEFVDYPLHEADKSLPEGHPNRAIHGVPSRSTMDVSCMGTHTQAKFTTGETISHGSLVPGHWPRHHELDYRYSAGAPAAEDGIIGSFRCDGKFTSEDPQIQPAGMCWHIQWGRTLDPEVCDDEIELLLAAQQVHQKKDGILLPLGPPEPTPSCLDISGEWRRVCGPLNDLDHCFSALSTPAALGVKPYASLPETLANGKWRAGDLFNAVGLRWPKAGVMAVITMSKNIRCVVVYSPTETDGPFFGHVCVELQTAWSNAPACYALGHRDSGLVYLKNGESLETCWQVTFYRV
jgi:hypothetical protein